MKASCGTSTLPIIFMRFLPFFCFSSSLRLRVDVATVAFGEHIFAQGLDIGAADHALADRGLDRHFEHLARDELAQLGDQLLAALVSQIVMDDHGQGVNRLSWRQGRRV